MESKTIKEFLVGIKYVQDSSSLNTVRTTIKQVGKELAGLGVGAGAGLVGFIAALNKTADALAHVYYQAKLAGGTAYELGKLKYAGDQVGHLGAQFVAIAQAMNQAKIASSGAVTGIWRMLGATSANPAQALEQMVAHLHEVIKQGPQAVMAFKVLAGNAGLDFNALYQAASGSDAAAFQKGLRDFHSVLKGAGINGIGQYNDMVKEAVRYQREWTKTLMTFSAGWDHLATEVMPTVRHIFQTIFQIIQSHHKEIDGFFESIQTSLAKMNTPAGFAQVKDELNQMADALGRMATTAAWFLKHQTVIKAAIGYMFAGPVGAVALSAYGKSVHLNQDKPGPRQPPKFHWYAPWTYDLLNRMNGNGHDKTAETNQKLRDWLDERTQSPHVEISTHKGVGQRLYTWLMGMGTYIPYVRLKHDAQQQSILSETMKTISRMPGSPASPMTPAGTLPSKAAQQQSLWESIRYFMSKGLTAYQAEGVTARLAKESGGNWLNPNAVNPTSGAYGIAQWLGSRKPAALQAGGSLHRQLELVWHELNTTEKASLATIMAARTPEEAGMAMGMYERANDPSFTRSAARYAGVLASRFKSMSRKSGLVNASRLNLHLNMPTLVGLAPLASAGGTQVAYHPTTHINVFGYGPEVGNYVFGTQSRVNADQVRNLTQIIQ